MKIGFIGLGIMGRPMALNLKAAGHELFVPDRRSLTDEIRAAATVEADAAAVAEHSDVIILMVPDTPDVERVLFGAHGVAEGLSTGKLVIDMSSISPVATKGFAERIAALGCGYLDAPVSGGEVGAKAASLTIMVGGATTDFDRAKPLFDLMGKNITHVGEAPGSGQVCKVANQIIVALNIQAVAEALTFAKKINALGCDYLDAPVSGGEVGAKQASLTIMVGGPAKAFERAKPLFEKMGKNITHVGEANGDGQTCKVANQIIVALNIQAVAEALVFASRAGADPAKVRAALMGGFASSRILELHGERMLNGTFNPGFRVRLHQKDLNLALSAARELGVVLPNTAIAQQMFSSCAAHGGADLDHSSMILAIEGLSSHSIREKT